MGWGKQTALAALAAASLSTAAQAQDIRIGGGYVAGELRKPMDITPFGLSEIREEGVRGQGFYTSLRIAQPLGSFEVTLDGLFNLYWTDNEIHTKDGERRVPGKSTNLSLDVKGPSIAKIIRPVVGLYSQAVPSLDAWVGRDQQGTPYPGFGSPFAASLMGSIGAEITPLNDVHFTLSYQNGKLFDERLAASETGRQRVEAKLAYDGFPSGNPLEVQVSYATEGKNLFGAYSTETFTGLFALGPFRSYLPGVEVRISHRTSDGITGRFNGIPLNTTINEASVGVFFRPFK